MTDARATADPSDSNSAEDADRGSDSSGAESRGDETRGDEPRGGRPGPTDSGGSGGMATRELAADD